MINSPDGAETVARASRAGASAGQRRSPSQTYDRGAPASSRSSSPPPDAGAEIVYAGVNDVRVLARSCPRPALGLDLDHHTAAAGVVTQVPFELAPDLIDGQFGLITFIAPVNGPVSPSSCKELNEDLVEGRCLARCPDRSPSTAGRRPGS